MKKVDDRHIGLWSFTSILYLLRNNRNTKVLSINTYFFREPKVNNMENMNKSEKVGIP